MADEITKKNFYEILKNFINYIISKINDEISITENSGDEKDINFIAFEQISKVLTEYKNDIEKKANELADKLSEISRGNENGSLKKDVEKINNIRINLNTYLNNLVNSYKKWYKEILILLNGIFTSNDETNLDNLNSKNRKLEITKEEDEYRKKLIKLKEIKKESLKALEDLKNPCDNLEINQFKLNIEGLYTKANAELNKEKISKLTPLNTSNIKFFLAENTINNIINKLNEFEIIYETYKEAKNDEIKKDGNFTFFDESGNLSLVQLYSYLLYKKSYNDFLEEINNEYKILQNLKNDLQDIKTELSKKKKELQEKRAEYNSAKNDEIKQEAKYKIAKIKNEISDIEKKRDRKKEEILSAEDKLKEKENGFVESSDLRFFDMKNEMIRVPFEYMKEITEEITDNIKLNEKEEIISITIHGKEIVLPLKYDSKYNDEKEPLGQVDLKDYGLVELFMVCCYLYREITKKSSVINSHIELFNNAILSKTNENSLYSIIEKIRYVYKEEIKEYLPLEDQKSYIESEWDFIFGKTEDINNGRNYWSPEFYNADTNEDIKIQKNNFKNFVKDAVIQIRDESNPLESQAKLQKYENKNLKEIEFYKNNFRKINGYYCFYLKDILASFKIEGNFVTIKDILLSPLLEKTGMNNKKDILYYKKVDKSLKDNGNINKLINTYWLKELNMEISKNDLELYDYRNEVEKTFKNLIRKNFSGV